MLKTGAAYVPLDPRLPVERLEFIVQDSGADLVVTQPQLEPMLAELSAKLVVLDKSSTTLVDYGSLPQPRLSDPAYLIYTSGSTGTPKGVIITHQSLVEYAIWARRTYSPATQPRFPLFSSFAFDLTVTSIFVPLISNGQIVVYEEDDDDVDASVIKVFEDNKVDVVKLTPSHLSLVKDLDLADSPIRVLIVGGEDFKTSLARDVSNAFRGRVDIYNEYGPTEATVACMIHRYDSTTDLGESVPIGVPVEHAEIYVLDDASQLVPVGTAGEICIGGHCLAEGYLNLPDLTAERFVDHPFAPGERIYRTGDIGRWQSNGRLDYLGRLDRQVKISGARIELTEIEAVLAKHPSVSQAVAAVSRHTLSDDDAFDGQACDRCGIPANHPDVVELTEGICNLCVAFEADRQKAATYFRTLPELHDIIDKHRQSNRGPHDCVALLSGGKDSTYALYKTVELGARPLVFSLDNGYISEGALDNIRRVTEHLGLELVLGSTPAMNEIFVESLHQFGNVCNGCFKTIYTLAMNLARERGIKYIVTGLSRGQIFDTRLSEFFRSGVYDPDTVDSAIIEARKAYHRANDVISRKLDVRMFDDDAVFDEIQFLDFYRYCDVPLEEIESFLADQTPWVRPEDTGRSTNCLINAAGIYVHLRQRGFHNYAGPYSWDVRLGHKTKDEATQELQDNLDEQDVLRILQEIGYADASSSKGSSSRLQAYYVAEEELSSQELQTYLKERLPNYMIPASFRRVDRVPLTDNGKVDESALLALDSDQRGTRQAYSPPRNETERSLARIWCEVLQLKRVGRDDNFWDLGGDSILNIQIVARANQCGFRLTARQLFDHPSIAELSSVVQTATPTETAAKESEVEQYGLSGLSEDSLKKLIDRLE